MKIQKINKQREVFHFIKLENNVLDFKTTQFSMVNCLSGIFFRIYNLLPK